MGENERLCTMQSRILVKRSTPQGSSNPGPLDPVRDTSSNDTSSTTTLCRKFLSNYQFVEK